MTDVGFVVAAYGVTFAALGLYGASLWRRTSRARAASLRIRRGAEGIAAADPGRGRELPQDEGTRPT